MEDTLVQAFLFAQETTTTSEEEGSLIDVVPGLMVWTILTFLIVLWFLRRFAFGRIQNLIDTRRDRIREALDEADKAREEARELRELVKREREDAKAERAAPRADPPRRRRSDPTRLREGDREGARRGGPAAPDRRDDLRGRREADRERELAVPIQVIQPRLYCLEVY